MKYGVKSDHKICFGASLSHTNMFGAWKKVSGDLLSGISQAADKGSKVHGSTQEDQWLDQSMAPGRAGC